MHLIPHEIPLYNINGSQNYTRGITCLTCLRLKVEDTEEWRVFFSDGLGTRGYGVRTPMAKECQPGH
jgi:hypothetical protein